MNHRSYNPAAMTAYVIGILGTFLIMVFLVWVMRSYTRPAPLGTARVEERRKALAELNAADTEALNHYGWVDQARGMVRLPINVAMELTIKEWANPAEARARLISLAQRAAPPQPAASQAGGTTPAPSLAKPVSPGATTNAATPASPAPGAK